MLRRTFQHIPGVGPFREKDLWARGISTWDDFPSADDGEVIISRDRDPVARQKLAMIKSALAQRDLVALAGLLPPREHWRLYPEFSDEVVFFDIETDGADSLKPTVVGLFDREGLKTFIEGRNLLDLPRELAKSPIWVSFNGSVFDVPVLKAACDELPTPTAHIDLRFLCQKVGWKGGLKEIETKLGARRPDHLRGVNGNDAVILWRTYQAKGEIDALRRLVEYNLYDAFQLRTVLDHAYNRAVELLACDVPRLSPFQRGDILYDLSRLLLAIEPTDADLEKKARVRGELDRQLFESPPEK
jgi:uncharacterized protein